MKKVARKSRRFVAQSHSHPPVKLPRWWPDFQQLSPELQKSVGIVVRRAARIAREGGDR